MHILLIAETLELYENYLNGTIPIELGLLNDLETLALQNNQLSGTIPTSLAPLLSKSQSLLLQYRFAIIGSNVCTLSLQRKPIPP